MTTDTSRGRPRGDKRAALAGWMAGRTEFTMGDLTRSMGWPMAHAAVTLHRAVSAGEVQICGSIRTLAAKRPVALYASNQVQPAAMPLAQMMRVWR
jgi:hypothetical protein